MLQSLHVKNLALIEEIEIEFGKGFNILTGETGAGKSILLGSVNLALGGRASKDIIRKGTKYGFVELVFFVENENQKKKLEQLDVFPEDDMIVLNRKIMEGRSISKINGETVSMGLLKEVASILIDIHGQHEHQSLLYKKNQMHILDSYFTENDQNLLKQVEQEYRSYCKAKEEWKKARADLSERAKEISFLEFEIQEIEDANLLPDEDEQLESEYRRMLNGKRITESAREAYEYTGSGSNCNGGELISRAIRCLADVSRYDEKVQELYQQLGEIEGLLSDFNHDLADYCDSLEFSEEEYYHVEERLNQINRLKTKYGNTIEQIQEYLEEKQERLKLLNDYDAYLQKLEKQLERTEKELEKSCQALTAVRKEQGQLLQTAICAELRELNFLDVSFDIRIQPLEGYTEKGKDDVEFFISLNPGEPVRPLAEVASGGELSRIMLAIKTVMAERDEIDTLIFDEIDVGISGRTAQKVSERMAKIGKVHQVICITHLAQIAAMADNHFLIQKEAVDGVTKTMIQELSEEESIQELARILGGAEITEAVLTSAEEMKKMAQNVK